jgi:hypothetical protein
MNMLDIYGTKEISLKVGSEDGQGMDEIQFSDPQYQVIDV